MADSDTPTDELTTEDLPDVRQAILRAFEHGRDPEELIAQMDEIREITFFDDYMSMKVLQGPLLDRLDRDEALRSDLELSLSAAFGRSMELKVHPYSS